MIENIIWLALGLLVAASFMQENKLIAKTGSLIALFATAYTVLKILPEIVDMIDGILNLAGGIFKHAG